jgi:hypothetical protein
LKRLSLFSVFALLASSAGCLPWSDAKPPTIPYRVLWLSDSIYNSAELWNKVTAPDARRPIVHETGTFAGTTSGMGLFELADRTMILENGEWFEAVRGTRFERYSALIFEYLRNDSYPAAESVEMFRKAYDKICAQGATYFPQVVTGNSPPQALPTLADWNLSTDFARTAGYELATDVVAAKWNTQHVDTYSRFLEYTDAGKYTVQQLMRDAYHQTYDLGMALQGVWITWALEAEAPLNEATPEIAGDVVNYLFGNAVAGVWAFEEMNESPLPRVASLSSKGHVARSAAARATFPSSSGEQIWAHFYVDKSDAGIAEVYVDRGTTSEIKVTIDTLVADFDTYPRSFPVAENLSPGLHTVEIESANDKPVRVLGITFVGVK